jgi:hypothetical protein
VAWVFIQAIAQHTKQKQKEQLKLRTPKTILRKPKERGKKKQEKNR